MPPDLTRGQSLTLIAAQLALALAATALERVVTGGVSFMPAILCLFLGGVLGFVGLGRGRHAWPHRPEIRRASLHSALAFWAIGAAGYAVSYWAQPAQLDFSPQALLGLAPLVGVLPGLAALVLTLCAGDTAATILGSYEVPREPPHPYDRFTDLTLQRGRRRAPKR